MEVVPTQKKNKVLTVNAQLWTSDASLNTATQNNNGVHLKPIYWSCMRTKIAVLPGQAGLKHAAHHGASLPLQQLTKQGFSVVARE